MHIKPAVLAIYHLNNDSYFNDANKEVVIDGSKGLTLNGNLFLNYHITDRKLLEVSFGFPFVTRTARPDGLTREFVIGLEYSYSF